MYLITGGAGYIGSHMALKLIDNNQEIVIFDNLETGHMETIERLTSLSDKVKFIKGDLKNKEEINAVFKQYKIDAVVHFAAYSLVEESTRLPGKYWRNNVFGSLNLLDSMVENDVDKIVFSSTCATYGNAEYTPIDENHPQKPVNPYGETKLAVEKIMDEYDKTYNLRSVRLRYFNVAGADGLKRAGEWHTIETHLIPNILKAAIDKKGDFKIFGDDYETKDGTCVRDYIDIDDLTEAHLLALKYLEKGGKTNFFNLGTKEGSSVKEVFEAAQKITGETIKFQIAERRPGDPAILIGNNKKAREVLGWQPKFTLNDSIKNAFEWEKERLALYR